MLTKTGVERYLTVVYLGLCSIVIVSALGWERSVSFVRQHAVSLVVAARESAPAPLATASVPIDAAERSPGSQKGQTGPLRRFQVPAGTALSARLRTPLDSASMRVDDQVDAVLREPVVQGDLELVPADSLLHGTVAEVVRASDLEPLGRVTIVFAVVQHASTRSRAGIKSRPITFEAQPAASDSGRRKRQPLDVIVTAGQHLSVTLAEPLLVYIPAGPGARRPPARGRQSQP